MNRRIPSRLAVEIAAVLFAAITALIIERLRSATPQGQTCSAGVADWDGEEGPGALLARADAALCEAKSNGRNRTAVATA